MSCPVDSSAQLPADCKRAIAARLESRDLLALSQVSHAWREASADCYERAYGPAPCHRAVAGPQDWRRALGEKVVYEDRLFAPLTAKKRTPAALQGPSGLAMQRALRLAWGTPLAAYIALQSAGEEALYTRDGLRITLRHLQREGLSAAQFAREVLTRTPGCCDALMEVGAMLGSTGACAAALQAGASMLWSSNFNSAHAAGVGDLEMLQLFLQRADTRRMSEALNNAVSGGHVSCAEAILDAGLLRDLPGINFAQGQDPATVRPWLDRLLPRGLSVSKCLLTTAANEGPRTPEVCAELVAHLGPEERQQLLDQAFADALTSPRVTGALNLGACGARFTGSVEVLRPYLQYAHVHWDFLGALFEAGLNPLTPFDGKPLVLILLERAYPLSLSVVGVVKLVRSMQRAGLIIDEPLQSKFGFLLDKYQQNAQLMEALLELGLDPEGSVGSMGRRLIAVTQVGWLTQLKLLVRYGANVHEYDDQFKTVIDYATDPACIAYLESRGARKAQVKSIPRAPSLPPL